MVSLTGLAQNDVGYRSVQVGEMELGDVWGSCEPQCACVHEMDAKKPLRLQEYCKTRVRFERKP